jgi:hypothetical protein
MEEQIGREEFYHAFAQLSKAVDNGFENVNRRLDGINGQVREHSTDIAVLKDRGNRDNTARATGLGGIAASAALFIRQLMAG